MIGTLIKEQYQIIELLGEGGMGEVYKALDVELDRQVALKFLKSEFCADKTLLQRFRDELKTLAGFNHANITTLYTTITWEGRPVMVMELVEGETLHRIVNRRGPVPANMAVPLIKQALAGVAVAHRKRIIHRDLKPANLMLNYDGVVKVMDFGIAKIQDAPGLTRSNTAIGTCLYMAPEQIRGNADARTDIYAMGITLYELLAGRVPFQGLSEYDIQTAHIQQIPDPPTIFYPHIPASVVDAVMRSLAKEPADRFQTAEEFSEALGDGISREKIEPIISVPGANSVETAAIAGVSAGMDFKTPSTFGPSITSSPSNSAATALPRQTMPSQGSGTQVSTPDTGWAPVQESAPPVQPELVKPSPSSLPAAKPWLLIAALAAAFLLVASGGVYWVYSRMQPRHDSSSNQPGGQSGHEATPQNGLPQVLQPESHEDAQTTTTAPPEQKPAERTPVKSTTDTQTPSSPMIGRWGGNYVRCEDDARTPAMLDLRQAAPDIVNGTLVLSIPGGSTARCAVNGRLIQSGKSVQFSVSSCGGGATPAFLLRPHTSLLSLSGGKLSGDVNPQTDVCETAEFRKM